MVSYRTQRVLPYILVVLIVIIGVVALVSFARAIFFPSSGTPETVDVSREALLNTSIGHSVSMTVRGPIVADEEFHSFNITISPTSRTLTTYSGYLDRIVDRVRLGNNVAAYEQFVYALDRANLAKGTEPAGPKNDVRGICATGRLYEYDILEDNQSVKWLWTSTCRGSQGSLQASADQLGELFYNQIPDANDVIREIDL